MRQKVNPFDRIVGAREAADVIDVTATRLGQLVAAGWIKKAGRDKYRLTAVISGYLAFLGDARRCSANQGASANRLAAARAEEIEQRIAAQSATLVTSSDVLAVLRETLAVIQSEFVGLPARATKDLALRRKLGDALDGALTRCAEKIDAFAANANLDAKPATRKRASRREAQIRG